MTLIKLHTRGYGDELYINPEYIVSFWGLKNGTCVKTIKDVDEDSGFLVQETPEQIIKRIEAAKEYPPLRLKGDKYEIQSME